MQIGILEPLDFSQDAIKNLEQIGNISKFEGNNIEKFLLDKEVLFVRLKYFLGEEILKSAKKLKFICTPTTGLNHIDLEFAYRNNIEIISLKGEVDFLSDIRATSEHTLGLILSLLRNYKNSFIVSETEFDRDKFKGFEIYNNRIGIIGYGRIGKLLSKYINAFGGMCYYYDLKNDIIEESGVIKTSSIEELINKSNIICLCASYNNDEIITSKIINQLKDKFFINTARGELVNEKYLIDKIKQNHFKGVAIDVIQNESNDINNLSDFFTIDKEVNFIITPHIGGATYTSMERTELFISQKLSYYL